MKANPCHDLHMSMSIEAFNLTAGACDISA